MRIPQKELELFEAWLLRYGRSSTTADMYCYNVSRAYQMEGDDPVTRLTDRSLSPKYLRVIRASLLAWADFCGDDELASELQKVKLPAALRIKQTIPLSLEQWKALRDEIPNAFYLKDAVKSSLGLLVCRGFRRSDVLRLMRTEITDALRKDTLSFEGKGRKRLEFTVQDSWRGYLEILADYKDWERVEDLVCPAATEGDARRLGGGRKIARALKVCGKKVGIEVGDLHPHLMRKTYATHYYRACLDPAKLQQHMQWANISTAMGYVDAGSREELDDIANSMFAE